MAKKFLWQRTITNAYLGRSKIVKGATRAEVQRLAALELAKWAEEEKQKKTKMQQAFEKKTQQEYLLALEEQARQNSEEAQQRIDALQHLLAQRTPMQPYFHWESFKKATAYPPFKFQEPYPNLNSIQQELKIPPRSLLEKIAPALKTKREALEAEAQRLFEAAVTAYEQRKTAALEKHEQHQKYFAKMQVDFNRSIDKKQTQFSQGDAETVQWVMTQILEKYQFPEDVYLDFEVDYEPSSQTAIITAQVPNLEEIPRIIGYKFVKGEKKIAPIEMKQKEFEQFYDSLIQQLVLFVIHIVFQNTSLPPIQSVVFNGWATGINPKTGLEFTNCIISVQTQREQFVLLNLAKVDPKACIRELKGLVAGPLAQLAPVKPLLDLNRADSRFIAAREILENMDTTENLAEMDWEDFEHLVRELFEKEFGGEGSEVHVTQASRDKGVDAVAFDPDPIRGGKFVIQAKRYNNVVPVGAVRELYGTMISEGATKGILVTTSYYGNDAREFAKDKPIALIDGTNLVYMFSKHGYQVKIELH